MKTEKEFATENLRPSSEEPTSYRKMDLELDPGISVHCFCSSSVNEHLNSIQEKMNTSAKSKNDSVLSELHDSQLSTLSNSVTHDEKSRI